MLIRNLIYILQSENYDIGRFIKFSYSRLKWWKLEQRKQIVWTLKARLICAMSTSLIAVLVLWFFTEFNWTGFLIIIPVIALLPFVIAISLLLIQPLDIIIKARRFKKAKHILGEKKLTIIGITGSYGKTSVKEILSAILGEKYKVLKTPENINTDIGIANFVIKNKEELDDCDIFIVEMGAYGAGDIAKICDIVSPDYAVLTGINESHLERFGSLDNIIKGKFELPERTKLLSVLNFDDKDIKNNFNKFKINKYAAVSKDAVKNIRAKNNFEGMEFEFNNIKFQTKLLAEHNITLILLCAEIAKELRMSLGEIASAVEKIRQLPHRLELIYNKQANITVIDDGYNGNIDGIISGLKVLGRAAGRKIILTPGLVELGGQSENIHRAIGALYAKKVDLVLLIKNSATKHIAAALDENNFKNYKIYDTAADAHNDLKNVLKSGDTIIFQNDWPDNYL